MRVANGWDNATFRLGEELAVRLPRRPEAVPLILHEQAYVPGIARHCPVAVPVPVHAGQPTSDFPWPWSIVRWVPGTAAADVGAVDRGVPLRDRDSVVMERLRNRGRYPQAAALGAVWAEARAVDPWDGPPVMLHGDLHPGNVLLADGGSLAGIIDFGDVGGGDPAVDLAVGWLMFDAGARHRFRAALGRAVDADTWMRARGWALILSTAMLSNSDDNPRMFAVGEFGISQVLEG